jgi:hypothetical protein
MKPVELSHFKGVRNDVAPERFEKGDLQICSNIELDETGKPYRRGGTTALDAVPLHSLWANDELAYGVRQGTLQQLNADFTWSDLGIPVSGERVAYKRVANDVFFSDGLSNGIVGTDGYRPWGIAVPPQPTFVKGFGSISPGKYIVTMTYVRRDGKESGASPVYTIDVEQGEGLLFTLPVSADPWVETKNLYLSDCNGEVPYLIATLNNSDTTAGVWQLPAGRTRAVRTLRMGPPPAGHVVGLYNGRMYVAENNYLWYSQPYEFELVHRAMNFLGFSSPVRTFAPVSDGVFIGSDDETIFMHGSDPKNFVRKQVAPYGTVLGTEVEIPEYYFGKGDRQSPIIAWMSTHGLCAGFNGGDFMNLTGGHYVPPEGVAKGASLLKVRGASPQLVTTLFS